MWECAPPQGLRFDSLFCQFEGISLASSKKKLMECDFLKELTIYMEEKIKYKVTTSC